MSETIHYLQARIVSVDGELTQSKAGTVQRDRLEADLRNLRRLLRRELTSNKSSSDAGLSLTSRAKT